MSEKVANESLLFIKLGMVLFLLGLLTGFGIPLMENPRMGVSSHLEGVLNGLFLVALGLIWEKLALPRGPRMVAMGSAFFGTFANWLAITLAAVWGTGQMTPVAGAGRRGSVLQELLVNSLLLSLSTAMILLCILVLWGLGRHKSVHAERP